MEFRYLGRFQAALIARASPRLASYKSDRGYAFSDGPGPVARIRELAKQMVPQRLRPFLRRQKARLKGSNKMPFYLEDTYVREIFPDGCPHIAPFVNLEGLQDKAVLSNALTLEIILSGKFCDDV